MQVKKNIKDTKERKITRSRTGRLNPINDYLFKQYMGTEKYKVCLVSFLNAVLGTDFKDVEILENLELPKDSPEGKFGRLEVRAKLQDGTQINIEVQLLNERNMIKRSQYYNGRLFISGIRQGEDYSKLGKVISINLLNFDYLPYREYHISSHFRIDQYPEELLTADQEIHFLELKKFDREEVYDINNPLHRWMKFFDCNLEKEALKELIRMDVAIAAADERMNKAAASEKEMRYYEAMEDARREMVSAINYHRNQGFKDGEEKGKAEEANRFATLMSLLLKDKRMAELKKVAEQPESREVYYKEYGIE
ncbi:MAG: Rpn family recombination-promoting nuclease/putative transposase [Anaerocolumna sp.]